MAYFVVMMKGCHYDSRFLRRHLNPHVYAIQESGELTTDALGRLGKQESTARALLDRVGQGALREMLATTLQEAAAQLAPAVAAVQKGLEDLAAIALATSDAATPASAATNVPMPTMAVMRLRLSASA